MMLRLLLTTCLLVAGCGITTTHFDPATKQVDITTWTLFKKVEGFTLDWSKEGQVHVALEKSSTEAQIVEAFAPIMREFVPMAQALATMRAAQGQ
jgi:hypothetical protein